MSYSLGECRRARPLRLHRRPLYSVHSSTAAARAAQRSGPEKDSDVKIRWGILGVARIATEKVIPAMQRGQWSEVTAIASRDLAKARRAASTLGIPKAYGSYDELLADPDIDAVYNPLPNGLHGVWTMRAPLP